MSVMMLTCSNGVDIPVEKLPDCRAFPNLFIFVPNEHIT